MAKTLYIVDYYYRDIDYAYDSIVKAQKELFSSFLKEELPAIMSTHNVSDAVDIVCSIYNDLMDYDRIEDYGSIKEVIYIEGDNER